MSRNGTLKIWKFDYYNFSFKQLLVIMGFWGFGGVKGSDPGPPGTGGNAPGTAVRAPVDLALVAARQARAFAAVAIVLSALSLGFAILR